MRDRLPRIVRFVGCTRLEIPSQHCSRSRRRKCFYSQDSDRLGRVYFSGISSKLGRTLGEWISTATPAGPWNWEGGVSGGISGCNAQDTVGNWKTHCHGLFVR